MLRTDLDRAEALFKKEERRRDRQEAMAEYQTSGVRCARRPQGCEHCAWRATQP
jgi:hypothetical protein